MLKIEGIDNLKYCLSNKKRIKRKKKTRIFEVRYINKLNIKEKINKYIDK